MSASELHKYLSYDQYTGALKWKEAKGGKASGDVAGAKKKDGYLNVQINSHSMACHRVAWAMHYGEWPNGLIDHINRVRHDNRISNLRIVTCNENAKNKKIHKNNKHGLKGVTKLKNGKYQAQCAIGGVNKYLGSYSTKQDAHEAYVAHALPLCGEFAGEFSIEGGAS